jgi:suppressor of fused
MRDHRTATGAAPGWQAIDQAIAPLVEGVAPVHWGVGTMIPDQDGLWGVSAYARPGHWFYVTYGLSELFTKISPDASVSGWGEELTMRVRREAEDGREAPSWPARLLARLGELVFERARPFWPGGRIELGDDGDEMPPALCWAPDPELGAIATPNGNLQFVATVGVGRDLLARLRAQGTAAALADVRTVNPLLVTGAAGLGW